MLKKLCNSEKIFCKAVRLWKISANIISRDFNYGDSFHDENEFMCILSTFENVFVNPNHLYTAWADFIQAHISNFEYVSKIADFEYFSLEASNNLFLRTMPNITYWDICCGDSLLEPTWHWYPKIFNKDVYLEDILKYFNADYSMARVSQVEGVFYRKEIFQQIVDVINKFYDYRTVLNKERSIYPREELYFSTIAYLINKDFKNLKNPYCFVDWNKTMDPFDRVINISEGKIEGKYSLKKIARNISDPIRFIISDKIGDYRNKTMNLIKIGAKKTLRKYFNLMSGRRRIFIGQDFNEQVLRDLFQIKTNETYLTFEISNGKLILNKVLYEMENNRDAIFIICDYLYPMIVDVISQYNFRENIDFIDGSMFY